MIALTDGEYAREADMGAPRDLGRVIDGGAPPMVTVTHIDCGLLPGVVIREPTDCFVDHFTARCPRCGAEFCTTSKTPAELLSRPEIDMVATRVQECESFVEALAQHVVAPCEKHR